jgi:hypothetical protein
MKGDMILEELETWIMKYDRLYTITCIAAPNDFSNYKSTFQNMLDSFEIFTASSEKPQPHKDRREHL